MLNEMTSIKECKSKLSLICRISSFLQILSNILMLVNDTLSLILSYDYILELSTFTVLGKFLLFISF